MLWNHHTIKIGLPKIYQKWFYVSFKSLGHIGTSLKQSKKEKSVLFEENQPN